MQPAPPHHQRGGGVGACVQSHLNCHAVLSAPVMTRRPLNPCSLLHTISASTPVSPFLAPLRLTRCRPHARPHRLVLQASSQPHSSPGDTASKSKSRGPGTRLDAAKTSTEAVATEAQTAEAAIKAELTALVEHPPATAAPPTHPPRWFSWFNSNEEEMLTINFTVNLSLIVICVAAAAAKFVTVDIDSWNTLTPMEVMLQLPSSNWALYEDAVNTNPLLTKACISGVVYTLGDLTAQTYEGRGLEDLDRGRILRSGICGFIAHGPLSHLYYENLDYAFNNMLMVDAEAWYQPLLKVGVDQTVWSLFWNSLYYVLLGVLKWESPQVIVQTVSSSWWDLLKAGWRLWPFAHIITYGVVPVQHRLLWVDAVELVWVTILSMYGQQQRDKLAAQAAAVGIEGVPVTQMSVPLPGADGKGGDPAEEILRSIQTEREVVLREVDGTTTTVSLTDVYADKAEQGP